MLERTNSKPGDCLFFIAEVPGIAETLAGEIREELGKRLNLIDKNGKIIYIWYRNWWLNKAEEIDSLQKQLNK